jgi:hypothetical protein
MCLFISSLHLNYAISLSFPSPTLCTLHTPSNTLATYPIPIHSSTYHPLIFLPPLSISLSLSLSLSLSPIHLSFRYDAAAKELDAERSAIAAADDRIAALKRKRDTQQRQLVDAGIEAKKCEAKIARAQQDAKERKAKCAAYAEKYAPVVLFGCFERNASLVAGFE